MDAAALAREVRQLQAALKAETSERDVLDEENRLQEKKLRALEKRLADTRESLSQEQRERDLLDRTAAQLERDKRQAELQLATLKVSAAAAAADVDRLREERTRLRQRFDRAAADADAEMDGLRAQLRAEKKARQDVQFKLEEEREDLRRQLARTQGPMRRENARLQAKVDDLERQLRAAAAAAKPGDARAAIETALRERADVAAELAQKKCALDEALAAAKVSDERAKATETELAQARQQIEELRERSARLEEAHKQQLEELREARAREEAAARKAAQSGGDAAATVERLHEKLDEAERERAGLAETAAQLEENLAEAREAAEKAEEQRVAAEDANIKLQAMVLELNEKLTAAAAAAASATPVITPTPTPRTASCEEADALKADLADAQAKLSQLETECKQLAGQLPPLAHERDALAKQLAFAKQDAASIAEQLHRAKQDVASASAESAELKEKLARLEAESRAKAAELAATKDAETEQREKIERELSRSVSEVGSLRTDVASASEKAEAERKRAAELESAVETARQQLRDEQAAARRSAARVAELEGTKQSVEEEAARLKRRVEELEELVEKLTRDVRASKESGEKQARQTEAAASGAQKQLEDAVRRLQKEKLEAEQAADEKAEKLAQDATKMRKELLAAQDELQDLDDKLQERELALKKALARIADMEADALGSQEITIKLKAEVARLEEDVETAEEAAKLSARKAKVFEEQAAQATADAKKAEEQLAEERKKSVRAAADLEAAAEASKKQLAEAVEGNNHLMALVESLKTELAQTQERDAKETQALRQELAAAQQKAPKASGSSDSERLKTENARLTKQVRELQAQIQDLQQQLAAAAAAAAAEPAAVAEEEGSETATKLTGPRRAAPAGRRAPTLPGAARRAGKDVLGAVALMPAGVTSEMLARKPAAGGDRHPSEDKRKKQLIQLKGRRNIKSWVVEPASSSLNSGDVFILDMGERIFQWNGSRCNRLERARAVDVVQRLNRLRGSRAKIVVIDDGDTEPDEAFSFWKELGPKAAVKKPEDGGDDAAIEAKMDAVNQLFRVLETGDLERVEGTRLMYEMLDESSCFILDANAEIYVWIGKSSPSALRSAAYAKASALLEEGKGTRPEYTEVVRCNQGGESILFCEKFVNWPAEATLGPQRLAGNVAASKKQERIDVQQLISAEPPERAPDVDDATGKLEIWRVVESEKVAVSPSVYGQFWAGNSYVCLYTFNSSDDHSYIVYFWQGVESTKTDMGTAAALALNMSKQYRGASQVRVSQNSEPPHFLRLFRGKLVCNLGSFDQQSKPTVRMFHVRGSGPENTCSVEVVPSARHLNTADTFVVLKDGSAFLWQGSASNDFAHEIARGLCKSVAGIVADPTVFAEGAESEEFWSLLGGKGEYASAKVVQPEWRARAFGFTTRTGTVTAEPLWRFTQADLHPETMMLLDAGSSVVLWLGPKAKEKDKKVALETAMDYAKLAEKTRGTVQLLQTTEGSEPVQFTAQFHGWRIRSGATTAVAASSAPAATTSVADALGEFSRKYPLDQLQNKATLPATVDRAKLEMYLSDDDFQAAFGMSRSAYQALPQWQQTPLKKKAGLF